MKNMTVVLLLMFAVIAAGVIAQSKGVPAIDNSLSAIQAQIASLNERIDDLEVAPAPQKAGYLKIGDIKGESTDDDHKDWINLLSVSQAIDRPNAGGRASGQAEFGDIVVVKEVDKSTPKLQEAIAKGTHIPDAQFELVRASDDGAQQTYIKYELKNVQVVSYSISGSGDQVPTEQVSLNFEEIKVTYTELDKNGTAKGNVEYEWKIEEGES